MVESVVPALEVRGLSKSFGGEVALDRADCTVMPGEVHAIAGQNGSGKSTFIKVLAGFHQPDAGGSAYVFGQELELGSASSASSLGIRFVHQDLGLVEDLSVVENLMLTSPYPLRGRILVDWPAARRRASRALARVGLDIDPRTPVSQLTLADRARIAIARALPANDSNRILLILDEPTASLSGDEVRVLFESLRRLRDAGNAVVIVTHHLEEVLDIADSITVLRDGKVVASQPIGNSTVTSLTELIVGHELAMKTRSECGRVDGEAVLELDAIGAGVLRDFSVTIRQGEIVGVAGLAGSGRESVVSAIVGRVERSGTITVANVEVTGHSPSAARRAGIEPVYGERARYGLFGNLTVRHNMTVGDVRRHLRCGLISSRSERAETNKWLERLSVVTRGPDASIGTLSGGNQQKVLIARALRRGPRVLALDDPTVGIDVHAREQVHQVVEQAASDGMAVLLVSTDAKELVRLCDRVLVCRRGRVAQEFKRGLDLTEESINHAQITAIAS